MKVADLLTADRILIPLPGDGFRHAVAGILERLEQAGAVVGAPGGADPLYRSIVESAEGEAIRLQDAVTMVAVETPLVTELVLGLGVAQGSFPVETTADTPPLPTRALFLVLTPRKTTGLRLQVIPALKRLLRETERSDRLLAAGSASEVRALTDLMDLELYETLQVGDASTPLTYRVYPDTPMSEVLDLMARKEVSALPVVGDKYQVLGIITAGEALRYLLPRRRTGEGEGESSEGARPGAVTARDVMSRAVMCIGEDHDLLDAANLMVNRDVARLPVISDGEIVGFLTRDAALRTLLGR